MAVSQYDKERLSESQQAQIQAVTDAAKAGSMDWGTAHSIAEGIRAQAAGGGYSGGRYGNEYNPVSTPSTGQSSKGSSGFDTSRNYSVEALDAAREYAKQASSGGTGNWGAVLDALANREQKVSIIGTDYGQSSNDILQELYDMYYAPYQKQEADIPSYGGSKWDSMLEEAAKELVSMNYSDWTQSDQYKALAERYGIQGKMTMQDVLGQISSRTGGLASSYATTAAQQQYNEYMSRLEEAARQMYSGDRSDLLDTAQLAQGLADRDYGRYLDELDQYYTDRNHQYQVDRDAIEDQRYADELAYAQEQQANAELADRAETLAAYGDFSGYKALGYTDEQVALMQAAYQAQNKPKEIQNPSAQPPASTPDYDGLFEAARNSGYPKSFIANNYKDYGFKSSTGLYEEYEGWGGAAEGGLNESHFNASMQSISAQLQAAKEDAALGNVERIWESLSDEQQTALQNMLMKFGIAYQP